MSKFGRSVAKSKGGFGGRGGGGGFTDGSGSSGGGGSQQQASTLAPIDISSYQIKAPPLQDTSLKYGDGIVFGDRLYRDPINGVLIKEETNEPTFWDPINKTPTLEDTGIPFQYVGDSYHLINDMPAPVWDTAPKWDTDTLKDGKPVYYDPWKNMYTGEETEVPMFQINPSRRGETPSMSYQSMGVHSKPLVYRTPPKPYRGGVGEGFIDPEILVGERGRLEDGSMYNPKDKLLYYNERTESITDVPGDGVVPIYRVPGRLEYTTNPIGPQAKYGIYGMSLTGEGKVDGVSVPYEDTGRADITVKVNSPGGPMNINLYKSDGPLYNKIGRMADIPNWAGDAYQMGADVVKQVVGVATAYEPIERYGTAAFLYLHAAMAGMWAGVRQVREWDEKTGRVASAVALGLTALAAPIIGVPAWAVRIGGRKLGIDLMPIKQLWDPIDRKVVDAAEAEALRALGRNITLVDSVDASWMMAKNSWQLANLMVFKGITSAEISDAMGLFPKFESGSIKPEFPEDARWVFLGTGSIPDMSDPKWIKYYEDVDKFNAAVEEGKKFDYMVGPDGKPTDRSLTRQIQQRGIQDALDPNLTEDFYSRLELELADPESDAFFNDEDRKRQEDMYNFHMLRIEKQGDAAIMRQEAYDFIGRPITEYPSSAAYEAAHDEALKKLVQANWIDVDTASIMDATYAWSWVGDFDKQDEFITALAETEYQLRRPLTDYEIRQVKERFVDPGKEMAGEMFFDLANAPLIDEIMSVAFSGVFKFLGKTTTKQILRNVDGKRIISATALSKLNDFAFSAANSTSKFTQWQGNRAGDLLNFLARVSNKSTANTVRRSVFDVLGTLVRNTTDLMPVEGAAVDESFMGALSKVIEFSKLSDAERAAAQIPNGLGNVGVRKLDFINNALGPEHFDNLSATFMRIYSADKAELELKFIEDVMREETERVLSRGGTLDDVVRTPMLTQEAIARAERHLEQNKGDLINKVSEELRQTYWRENAMGIVTETLKDADGNVNRYQTVLPVSDDGFVAHMLRIKNPLADGKVLGDIGGVRKLVSTIDSMYTAMRTAMVYSFLLTRPAWAVRNYMDNMARYAIHGGDLSTLMVGYRDLFSSGVLTSDLTSTIMGSVSDDMGNVVVNKLLKGELDQFGVMRTIWEVLKKKETKAINFRNSLGKVSLREGFVSLLDVLFDSSLGTIKDVTVNMNNAIEFSGRVRLFDIHFRKNYRALEAGEYTRILDKLISLNVPEVDRNIIMGYVSDSSYNRKAFLDIIAQNTIRRGEMTPRSIILSTIQQPIKDQLLSPLSLDEQRMLIDELGNQLTKLYNEAEAMGRRPTKKEIDNVLLKFREKMEEDAAEYFKSLQPFKSSDHNPSGEVSPINQAEMSEEGLEKSETTMNSKADRIAEERAKEAARIQYTEAKGADQILDQEILAPVFGSDVVVNVVQDKPGPLYLVRTDRDTGNVTVTFNTYSIKLAGSDDQSFRNVIADAYAEVAYLRLVAGDSRSTASGIWYNAENFKNDLIAAYKDFGEWESAVKSRLKGRRKDAPRIAKVEDLMAVLYYQPDLLGDMNRLFNSTSDGLSKAYKEFAEGFEPLIREVMGAEGDEVIDNLVKGFGNNRQPFSHYQLDGLLRQRTSNVSLTRMIRDVAKEVETNPAAARELTTLMALQDNLGFMSQRVRKYFAEVFPGPTATYGDMRVALWKIFDELGSDFANAIADASDNLRNIYNLEEWSLEQWMEYIGVTVQFDSKDRPVKLIFDLKGKERSTVHTISEESMVQSFIRRFFGNEDTNVPVGRMKELWTQSGDKAYGSSMWDEQVWKYSADTEAAKEVLERGGHIGDDLGDEFVTWFGNSKVVDDSGNPLVVYHGTHSDVTEFSKDKVGSASSLDERGFFFTSSKMEASSYAERSDFGVPKPGGNVIPAYVSLQNPLIVDEGFLLNKGERYGDLSSLTSFWDEHHRSVLGWADEIGADGIIISKGKRKIVIAFEPEQILPKFNRKSIPLPSTPVDDGEMAAEAAQTLYRRTLSEADARIAEVVKMQFPETSDEMLASIRSALKQKLDPRGFAGVDPVVAQEYARLRTATYRSIYTKWAEELPMNLIKRADGRLNELMIQEAEWELIELTRLVDDLNANVPADRWVEAARKQGIEGLDPNDKSGFTAWFGGSAVVDDAGKPMEVYHGTKSPEDFGEFSTTGVPYVDDEDMFDMSPVVGYSGSPDTYIGAHFAEEPYVANGFAGREFATADWQKSRNAEGSGRVMPVYLSVKNPIQFDEEIKWTHFMLDRDMSHSQMFDAYGEGWAGDFDIEDMDAFYAKYDADAEFRIEVNQMALNMEDEMGGINEEFAGEIGSSLKRQLQEMGHDGVHYKNDVEGGWSWIAFEPTQIKSKFNRGTFDPNNPDILDRIEGVFDLSDYRIGLIDSMRKKQNELLSFIEGNETTQAMRMRMWNKLDGGFTDSLGREIPPNPYLLSLYGYSVDDVNKIVDNYKGIRGYDPIGALKDFSVRRNPARENSDKLWKAFISGEWYGGASIRKLWGKDATKTPDHLLARLDDLLNGDQALSYTERNALEVMMWEIRNYKALEPRVAKAMNSYVHPALFAEEGLMPIPYSLHEMPPAHRTWYYDAIQKTAKKEAIYNFMDYWAVDLAAGVSKDAHRISDESLKVFTEMAQEIADRKTEMVDLATHGTQQSVRKYVEQATGLHFNDDLTKKMVKRDKGRFWRDLSPKEKRLVDQAVRTHEAHQQLLESVGVAEMRGALPYTQRIMTDYAQSYNIDEIMKFFVPFWMFPSRSTPVWLEAMAQHPEIVSSYYRYMAYSRRVSYQEGGVTSSGEQRPSLAGHIPVPGVEGVWFNPLSPLSFQYIIPKSKSFDEDLDGMNMLQKVSYWTVSKMNAIGLNIAPWILLPLQSIGWADATRGTLFPMMDLMPPFAMESIRHRIREFTQGIPGVPQSSWVSNETKQPGWLMNLLKPEVPWQDYIVESRMLTDLQAKYLGNPYLTPTQKQDFAYEVEKAVREREGNALWDETVRKVAKEEWVRRTVGYFTGVYSKPFSDADAERIRLTTEMNMLRDTINDQAGAMILGLNYDAEARNNYYVERRYNTPEGHIHNLYNIIGWVRSPDNVPLSKTDRRDYLVAKMDEDRDTSMYYDALGSIQTESNERLSNLAIGDSAGRARVFDEYFNKRIRLDRLYEGARMSWSIGFKPETSLMKYFEAQWWAMLRETSPNWEDNMDYDEWQLEVERWKGDIPFIAQTMRPSLERLFISLMAKDEGQELRPEDIEEFMRAGLDIPGGRFLNVAQLVDKLIAESDLSHYEAWQKSRDNKYDAMNEAWLALYWNPYQEAVGPLANEEREIAHRKFLAENPPPNTEQMVAWVMDNYGDQFTRFELEGVMNAGNKEKEVFTIDKRTQAENEMERMKDEIYEIIAMADPGSGKINDGLRVVSEHGENHLQVFFEEVEHWEKPENFEIFYNEMLDAKEYLQLQPPTGEQLYEWAEARRLNDLNRQLVDEYLGPDLGDILREYSTLEGDERKQFYKDNPVIQQKYDLNRQFAQTYKVWAKYYDPYDYERLYGEK